MVLQVDSGTVFRFAFVEGRLIGMLHATYLHTTGINVSSAGREATVVQSLLLANHSKRKKATQQ